MVQGFDIDKESYEEILKRISLMGPQTELECKFKETINKDDFTRMIQYCRSTGMHETLQDDQLDIFCALPNSPSNIRISLVGKDKISNYCKTNNLPGDVTVITKEGIKGMKPLIIKDLNFKIDINEETPLDDLVKQELMVRLPLLEKAYRYKKRFSYENMNIRYDFTIVKSSNRAFGKPFMSHKGFVTSGVVGAPEVYEAEIEYIGTGTGAAAAPKKRGKKTAAPAKTDGAHDIFNAMVTLYLVYKEESRYIPPAVKKEALTNYLRLCFGNTVDKDLLERVPRAYFAAPQPVTLERKNLVKPDLGVVSAIDNYTVTEKADGERCLMFVNADGGCYMIDSRLNFKFTGVKLNNLVNTLIDGEYITRDVTGQRISMFGAFDVYFYNTDEVRKLPLVGGGKGKDRVSIMNEIEKRFASKFESEGGIRFFAKQFLYEGNVFENSKKVLDQTSAFPYKIDGLILTPANVGVGGYSGATGTFGTWDRVFKYKPPEENTIDFLVKFGMLNASDNKVQQELELYVGYNPQQYTRIKPYDYIKGNTKQRKGYFEMRFEPANVFDGSASSAFLDKSLRCANGDVISDKTIVEFAWIDNAWVPTRVRKDKTDLYRKQGLSRTANDIRSALSIWRSIQNPIIEDMMTGRQPVPQDNEEENDDAYYFRNIDRDKMATKAMLDFHNLWIKNACLIQKYKGKTMLDIACGKAGDINKWVDAGYQLVIGIDNSRDNIENPIDGAYARTLKKQATSTKFLYLTLDGGERFEESYFNEAGSDGMFANIAWGWEKPALYDKEQMKYYNIVPRAGFDVVSCQFAIHYFFESTIKLQNFVKNVASNLRPGGYFIGTCLDSKRVLEELEKAGGSEVRGMKDSTVIWNIRKKGPKAIEIYMESIGKKITEYLVDFDVLVEAFAKYDMHLAVPITSFETEWNRVMNEDASSPRLKERVSKMTDIEKMYSFMNVYFVFQKKT